MNAHVQFGIVMHHMIEDVIEMLARHPFPPLAKCNHRHLHKVKIVATWEVSNCHMIMTSIWRHISVN